MGKTAVKKKTTTSEPSAQRYVAALDIKQRFIGEAFGLGWRLIITFLLPVLIGAWLDSRFDTKPSYTLVGIFMAIAASILVIQRTVKDISQPSKPAAKRKTNV